MKCFLRVPLRVMSRRTSGGGRSPAIYPPQLFSVFMLSAVFTFLAGCAAVDADAKNSKPAQSVQQGDAAFSRWLGQVKKEALAAGIRPDVVSAAMDGVQLQEKILKLDRKQPEKTISFPEYREKIVSEKRINSGIEEWSNHQAALETASRRYGVPVQYIIALWGIETSYGEITGNYNLVEAIATLAYDGRRKDFFHKELMNSLKMLNEGMVALADFKGSWAGAMGHCQFMPSSYLRYAVDADGDGRRDIWNNYDDIFASIANYLHTEGWDGSVEWGVAVNLPAGFNRGLIGRETKKTVAEWQALGISPADVTTWPQAGSHAYSIVQPQGSENAYMVSRNYDVIMNWNRSLYFATSVGMLADAIRGGR